MDLTVCVCTHNRPRYLRDCLDGLCRQTAAAGCFSVIIVDSGSPEPGRSEIQALVRDHLGARLIRVDAPGVSAARNAGAAAADTDYIAYIDDDAIPAENWVLAILAALATPSSAPEKTSGLRPETRQEALPPGPPAKARLCNPSIGWFSGEGQPGPCKVSVGPPQRTNQKSWFQGPLPLAEIQEAEPPGGVSGQSPEPFLIRSTPHPAVLAGRILPKWEAPLPAWWPPSLRGVLSIIEHEGQGEFRTAELPLGLEPYACNMVVHVPSLLAAGGFGTGIGRIGETLLSDEEVQLAWRLQDAGLSVRYDSRIVVFHQIQARRLTPVWLLSRLYWQGASTVLTRRLLHDGAAVWWELPRRLMVATLFAPAALWPVTSTRLLAPRWRRAYAAGFVRAALGWRVTEAARRIARPDNAALGDATAQSPVTPGRTAA